MTTNKHNFRQIFNIFESFDDRFDMLKEIQYRSSHTGFTALTLYEYEALMVSPHFWVFIAALQDLRRNLWLEASVDVGSNSTFGYFCPIFCRKLCEPREYYPYGWTYLYEVNLAYFLFIFTKLYVNRYHFCVKFLTFRFYFAHLCRSLWIVFVCTYCALY